MISSLATPKPATTEGPDPRGLPERQGDALVEALRLAATCDQLPTDGGERPTLLITLPFDALRDHLPPTLFNHPTRPERHPDKPGAAKTPANHAEANGHPDRDPDEDRDGNGDGNRGGEVPTAPPADGPHTAPHHNPPGTNPTNPSGDPTDDPVTDDPTVDDPAADRPPAPGQPPDNHPTPGAPTTEHVNPNQSNPFAILDGIGLIDARIARRLACDCAIIPIVLGANSEPLDIGRKTRIIPTSIRRALITRDRGCTFPGCTATPKHCDAHHIIQWANGGPTALPNLTLLCGQHHRLLHHSEWTIRIATDGHPEFIPPTYLDPTHNPRRNRAHPRPG